MKTFIILLVCIMGTYLFSGCMLTEGLTIQSKQLGIRATIQTPSDSTTMVSMASIREKQSSPGLQKANRKRKKTAGNKKEPLSFY